METVKDDNILILNDIVAYFEYIDGIFRKICERYGKDYNNVSGQDFNFCAHIVGLNVFQRDNKALLFTNGKPDRNKIFTALEVFLMLAEKYNYIPSIDGFVIFSGMGSDKFLYALDNELIVNANSSWDTNKNDIDIYINPITNTDSSVDNNIDNGTVYSSSNSSIDNNNDINNNSNIDNNCIGVRKYGVSTNVSILSKIIRHEFENLRLGSMKRGNIAVAYIAEINRLEKCVKGRNLALDTASQISQIPTFNNEFD